MSRRKLICLVLGAVVAWWVYTDFVMFLARLLPDASNPIALVVRGMTSSG